jgi:hypothetical protein
MHSLAPTVGLAIYVLHGQMFSPCMGSPLPFLLWCSLARAGLHATSFINGFGEESQSDSEMVLA